MSAKSDEFFLFRILEIILKNKLLGIPQRSLFLQIMMRKKFLMRRMDGKYQESTAFLLKENGLLHFFTSENLFSNEIQRRNTEILSKIYINVFIYKKNSLTILEIHPFLSSKCTNYPLKNGRNVCALHT